MTRSRIGVKGTLCLALAALALVAGVLISQNALAGPAASRPSEGKTASSPSSKIDARVLADTANGARTSVVIYLADQANVNAATSMKDQDARGWYVYNSLKDKADRTQGGLKALLTTQGVAYQSFWVANMIVADGLDAAQVNLLAARSDVARLDSNHGQYWLEDPAILNAQDTTNSPATIEWGVQRVNAPAVWALGYTGQGIVVGNQDTGMRWTHTFIKSHYRGWDGTTADHNYNWHDSVHTGGGICGPNSAFPCDDHGHGTHTTGTMVGDDGAGNQVGVAPGAKWIGCRNMDQGNGTPASYSECFQFFIAPTDLSGNNPNPALRPHAMNNSWGCPVSEGCTTRAELETIVNNTEAAGIFVEASAGNSGPGCSSVSDPPSIYDAAFASGAIDINNTLASFSSRGPSTFYTPNILKPQVSAPGVNVRSSTNGSDTSSSSFSGTSMAGPHVVGVVALLWSARPQLVRDIAATKAILENTANPQVVVAAQTCGGIPSSQIPNNSFGYGRVDALAAVNSVPEQGTPSPTATGGPAATSTTTPTPVVTTQATSTATATATPGTCTVTFNDVPVGSTFYDYVRCLACRGIVGGYPCGGPGEPCPGNYYRPNNNVTRGQVSKIVSESAGFNDVIPSTQQTFEDVAPGSTFALWVERLAGRGIIGGYPCGGPFEPCVSPGNRPYFRPNNNVTRGQLSKITSGAAGWTETPTSQTFEDVPVGSTFYLYIERMAVRGIISGYPCGGPFEPCVAPGNRPYFRPNNNATRGQMSKIAASAFFPNCSTPLRAPAQPVTGSPNN